MSGENAAVEVDSIGKDIEDVIGRLEAEVEDDPQIEAAPEPTPDGEPELEASPEPTTGEDDQGEPAGDPDPAVAEEPAKVEPPKYAAPVDWPEELKSGFRDIPEAMQERIHQREVEVSQMFQNTANERRLAGNFMKVVEPFRGLMAAEGVKDPLQAVQGLMATTAQLAMGAPEVKARKIAELVQHYGVPVELLDKALVGQIPENPEQNRMEQFINQRLAPMENYLRGEAERRQNMQSQAAARSIEEFGNDPKHEFFPQVRNIMADFLDLATQRNEVMSLEEAYMRACNSVPEIAKTIAGRNLARSAPNPAVKTEAAASIPANPSGGTNPEAPSMEGMGVREILERTVPGGDSRI